MDIGQGFGNIIGASFSENGANVNLDALYKTIAESGAQQRDLINSLPQEIQQNLAAYAKANGLAALNYQNNVQTQGNDYLNKVAAIYGPDTPAAQEAMKAAKTQIYSTVPGTQDAVRGAMASTGGLARGHAGAALAAPYMQAATQYGQKASDIATGQLQQGQDATKSALATVNSMNEQMFTQLFGMSKAQAQQILTTGNQALQTQLTELINQSTNETNQKLGLEGIASNNDYQNQIAANAKSNYMVGQAGNIAGSFIDMGMSSGGGGYGAVAQGILGSGGGGGGNYYDSTNNANGERNV